MAYDYVKKIPLLRSKGLLIWIAGFTSGRTFVLYMGLRKVQVVGTAAGKGQGFDIAQSFGREQGFGTKPVRC